jgi:hypothetical protein
MNEWWVIAIFCESALWYMLFQLCTAERTNCKMWYSGKNAKKLKKIEKERKFKIKCDHRGTLLLYFSWYSVPKQTNLLSFVTYDFINSNGRFWTESPIWLSIYNLYSFVIMLYTCFIHQQYWACCSELDLLFARLLISSSLGCFFLIF